jgi:hypothetical protein
MAEWLTLRNELVCVCPEKERVGMERTTSRRGGPDRLEKELASLGDLDVKSLRER